MSEGLNETDHELRSLLRFASGLGFGADIVRAVYEDVCAEAVQAGGVSDEDRLAEVRRRLLLVDG